MRVAINGMGRIGRVLFRRLLGEPGIELVAINDVMPPDNLLYLLRYDSVYGTLETGMRMEDGLITVGSDGGSNGGSEISRDFGRDGGSELTPLRIRVLQQPDPLLLPWRELQVDVVLECSGKFGSMTGAGQHLEAGAGRVLLSTTGSTDMPLMIYGFNHAGIRPDQRIVSPGGCMTNCSVHILYLLNSIGIRSAQINFMHSYTSRQELVDAPHAQFRRGRAAAESVIPVEIDLHQSLERIMPQLGGRIAALSTRVPVANGAMGDFSIVLTEEVTVHRINELFRKATALEYAGILDYTEEQLVSLDYKGNKHSCVIDGSLTSVVGAHVRVIAWFDNEYGFTSRMIDWLHYLAAGA